ncbi:MAG TPA: phosphomethylpyrimidine synthase ThiC [Candidatus Aminicenantes bacterium]|nr:phosphomethylpyrimidine synthase ThiC [Candidatus Aminicenantes bacterium]
MTQMGLARREKISPQMIRVADREGLDVEFIRREVAAGRIVIPANRRHERLDPIGIGKGLRTKVNANIGTSKDFPHVEAELRKLEIALRYQADTVMDLSTGGDITAIRRTLLAHCTIPFGNVPVYEMVVDANRRQVPFVDLKADEMFAFIRRQAEDGVDYMTVHAGLTGRAVEYLRNQGRTTNIVSRGGSLVTGWMMHNQKENPFFERFDDLLQIAEEHDVTLSLGDGLRPGCLADGTDRAQIEELITLGELVRRCRAAGVQVMVEGPGHLPLDQVETNIRLQKSLCENAPFYVLGPLVTDVAPGYDHITSAIGGAVAAAAGADFLCYVTPSEHLGLPDEDDVRMGIMAARIAAHAGDIAKKVSNAAEWDRNMGMARRNLDWETQEQLAMDPQRFREVRGLRATATNACSMCGEYCVYKILEGKL